MGVFAGPKVPVNDLCLVADAKNSKIITNSTTTITNIIESSNNLTGTGISIADDETAGRSFSLKNSNRAMNSNWTPVINKYSFSVIYWIKFEAGKSGDYTRIWEMDTIDNSVGYYYTADTRTAANPYIHSYVRDYNNADWAAVTPITNANWNNSSTWFQLAITVAQESEYKNYLNGKLTSTTPTSTEDLSSYGNIDQIELGNSTGNVGCRVGYFSVYRRPLTAAEVKENFEALRDRFGI